MIKNVLFSSVGGQGAVLASRVVALGALSEGMNVRACETIGMAQRGGSVATHVRYGDEKIHSPLIPPGSADVMIAAEPGEGARNIAYLKPDGEIFTVGKCLAPVTAGLSGRDYSPGPIIDYLKTHAKTTVLDHDEVTALCGSDKVINVALVALALKNADMRLSVDAVANALAGLIKPHLLMMNLMALYSNEAQAQAAYERLRK